MTYHGHIYSHYGRYVAALKQDATRWHHSRDPVSWVLFHLLQER